MNMFEIFKHGPQVIVRLTKDGLQVIFKLTKQRSALIEHFSRQKSKAILTGVIRTPANKVPILSTNMDIFTYLL